MDTEFTTSEKCLHREFLGIKIIFIGFLFFQCVLCSFAFVLGSLMLFGKPNVCPVPRGSI